VALPAFARRCCGAAAADSRPASRVAIDRPARRAHTSTRDKNTMCRKLRYLTYFALTDNERLLPLLNVLFYLFSILKGFNIFIFFLQSFFTSTKLAIHHSVHQLRAGLN